jgi:hypothetical protein
MTHYYGGLLVGNRKWQIRRSRKFLLACGLTVGHLTVNQDGEGSNPSVPANFSGAVRLLHERVPRGGSDSVGPSGLYRSGIPQRALTDTNEASLHAYHRVFLGRVRNDAGRSCCRLRALVRSTRTPVVENHSRRDPARVDKFRPFKPSRDALGKVRG